MVTKEQVIERLETILDPELSFDIWTLGLIYDIKIVDDKTIAIVMTLTTPLCPAGPYLQQEVTDAMRELGFSAVQIEVTFDPPWKPSDKLREMLGV